MWVDVATPKHPIRDASLGRKKTRPHESLHPVSDATNNSVESLYQHDRFIERAFCMRAVFIRCFCFVMGLFLIISTTGCWFQPPHPTGLTTGRGHRSFTGTFGHHKLDSADAVQDYNARIKEWFMEQGFTVVDDMTYRDLVDERSWSGSVDGVLLVFKHDLQSLVYVFIPESYRPEDNMQNIAYHADWTGSLDDLKKYDEDFKKLDSQVKRFR